VGSLDQRGGGVAQLGKSWHRWSSGSGVCPMGRNDQTAASDFPSRAVRHGSRASRALASWPQSSLRPSDQHGRQSPCGPSGQCKARAGGSAEWAYLPIPSSFAAGEHQDITMAANRRPPPAPSAVVRGSLADGLTVCLSLLASDPARFEPAAVAWHRCWCAALPGIGFAESRAALSALEGLRGPDLAGAARRPCARRAGATISTSSRGCSTPGWSRFAAHPGAPGTLLGEYARPS
jgi:hypothetical protein